LILRKDLIEFAKVACAISSLDEDASTGSDWLSDKAAIWGGGGWTDLLAILLQERNQQKERIHDGGKEETSVCHGEAHSLIPLPQSKRTRHSSPRMT